MGTLAATVALHDVRDAESFVSAAVRKLALALSADEREELQAAGLVIMCELARRYTPTHARKWSFCTYAGNLLPRRLISEWHRQNRGAHVRPHRGGWEYREAIGSLDCEMSKPSFNEQSVRLIGCFERPPVRAPA